jgi:2',3'-cyclic-nucleotide 2'-phosphodiesterase (5'-nucleotidase family)
MGVRLFSGVLLALASCLLVHAFDAQIAVDSLTPTSISFAQYQTDHAPGTTPPGSPNAVHVTVMHINDLYELIPSGTLGGVARLKTMLNGLEQLNPNTISVLAGDLFSPSALSSVAISSMGGQPFDGIQMVTVANEFGLDYATLGSVSKSSCSGRQSLACSAVCFLISC